ncbi:hypothetical protein ATANTOWER_002384 [Ataeniobius toweri]|uniref:Uncharacterized protein n=1 Tax=Ataeniobius toweri TaxID=208326 RepID=A0ABU7AEW2_9TELE|nr:hypothetical protein [Ataeniobius toweri]
MCRRMYGTYPKWSQVVKRHPRQAEEAAVAKSAARSGFSLGRWKARQTIVGTGAAGNIKIVKTKIVSVFASKFSPELEAEALCAYLKPKLGLDVTCHRINTANSRYVSFKVSAECSDVTVMYNPEL